MTEISSITDPEQQSEVKSYTQAPTLPKMPSIANETHVWSLYFDGSNSQEGAGDGHVLIDPTGKKTFIACRLDFECTNNTVK